MSSSRCILEDMCSLPIEDFRSLWKDIDAVVFDCDGVLWLQAEMIENANNVIAQLKRLNIKVFFLTNNSTRTREELLEKLINMKFDASVDDIVITSHLTGVYLKNIGLKKKAYVLGTPSFGKELERAGIQHLPMGPDAVDSLDWGPQLSSVELDPDVGAVVVGFDPFISYMKLFKAASYLNRPEVEFIATNTDEYMPGPHHKIFPGTGSIVQAVATASGRKPHVIGKPETFAFEYLKEVYSITPDRTLMVGDRCNTDILFGKNCGMLTLLVLTGVTSLSQAKEFCSSEDQDERNLAANFYVDSIGNLLPLLEKISV